MADSDDGQNWRGCCFLFSMVGPIDQASRAHQFAPSFISIRPILAGIGVEVEEERAVAFVSSCQLILIFVLLVRMPLCTIPTIPR